MYPFHLESSPYTNGRDQGNGSKGTRSPHLYPCRVCYQVSAGTTADSRVFGADDVSGPEREALARAQVSWWPHPSSFPEELKSSW